jgi:hypothetical protein
VFGRIEQALPAKEASNSATQMQQEDSLSFLSAVLGALGSTLTTPTGGSQTVSGSLTTLSGNPQTLFAGLVISAVAKTLPSLKENRKNLEDLILFVCAVLAALAAGIQAQTGLPPWPSLYAKLPITLLLIGVLGKSLVPMVQVLKAKGVKGLKTGVKIEDTLTVLVAIVALILLAVPLTSNLATVGTFCAFLTKALTSSPDTQQKK